MSALRTRCVQCGRTSRQAGLSALLFPLLIAIFCGSGTARAAPEEEPAGTLVPDCGGRIAEWVLFLADKSRGAFLETHAQLILSSSADSRFQVHYGAVESRRALEELLARAGFEGAGRIRWQLTASEVPYWTRDLFLVGQDAAGRPLLFLHAAKHYETLAEGLETVGEALLSSVRGIAGVGFQPTGLVTEGGATVVAQDRVFVGAEIFLQAVADATVEGGRAFIQELTDLYGRMVVVLAAGMRTLGGHCDLYLTPVGDKKILLADPLAGCSLLRRTDQTERDAFTRRVEKVVEQAPVLQGVWEGNVREAVSMLLEGSRFAGRIAALRRVKTQLESLGYQVYRVPFLGPMGGDRELCLTWNNVVQEVRDGEPTVYLPRYGLPTVDDEAARIWEKLGYRVVAIDALGPAMHGGSLRCLTQVFRSAKR